MSNNTIDINVAHPNSKKNTRMGECNRNHAGQIMTIIQYDNNCHIVVQFEDGTTVPTSYHNFRNGTVRNPRWSELLGKLFTYNGLNVTVVQYNNYYDIIVESENGMRFSVTKPQLLSQKSVHKSTTKSKVHRDNPNEASETILARERHIGETRQMNCGNMATIINWTSGKNITIQFDDGALKEQVAYVCFQRGNVKHPNKESRKGHSKAEIILQYYFASLGFIKKTKGSLRTIDPEFGKMEFDLYHPKYKIAIEYDGEYWHSLSHVQETDAKKDALCQKNHIHLIRVREPKLAASTNPNVMSIIRHSYNETEFSEIIPEILQIINNLHNISWTIDVNLARDNEKILTLYHAPGEKHIGEMYQNNSGENMTIIEYTDTRHVTVQFDDGTTVCTCMHNIKCGKVRNPSTEQAIKDAHIGETTIANCGMEMTLIRYGNASDVDVRFADGTEVYNRSYRNFVNGAIHNPNLPLYQQLKAQQNKMAREQAKQTKLAVESVAQNLRNQERVGECSQAACGCKMRIKAYFSSQDIEIEFDDGEIVTEKTYRAFQQGKVGHPGCAARKRIGQTNHNNQNQRMTVVAYRNASDIDIQFDDGKLMEHTQWQRFINGTIKHPDIPIHTTEKRIGLQSCSKDGVSMTIVEYVDVKNMTVQFVDGETRKTNWEAWNRGRILRYPPIKIQPEPKPVKSKRQPKPIKPKGEQCANKQSERIGSTMMANCGQKMTIIRYANRRDIDVMFEDGTIVCNREYNKFICGGIHNPNLPQKKPTGRPRKIA